MIGHFLNSRHRLFTLLVFGFAFLIGKPSKGETPALPSGDVRVLVFQDGVPLEGFSLSLGAQTQATNNDGVTVFSALSGQVQLTWTDREAPPKTFKLNEVIDVVSNQEVEVILNLDLNFEAISSDIEKAIPTKKPNTAENSSQRISLRGAVQKKANNAPIQGVQVLVRGINAETVTDALGVFKLSVPAGNQEFVFFAPGYKTMSMPVLAKKGMDEISIKLEKTIAKLDDFVVTAPFIEGGIASLLSAQRSSSNVSEVIGAEQMSRSGDSNAASALKRVTGLSLIGGRFVYVRGMGERYSSTLLNGQYIPSPEPQKRVVPLNLFSTQVLEGVTVQKSPSPDSPGEFGGGIVRLKTKSHPDAFSGGFSLGIGLRSNASLRGLPDHQGGRWDFLGIDDGSRSLPGPISNNVPLVAGSPLQPGFSNDELADFGRLLTVNYNVNEATRSPNLSGQLHLGSAWNLFGKKVGVLFTQSYQNNHTLLDTPNRRVRLDESQDDGLNFTDNTQIVEATQSIATNSMLNVGIELSENHNLEFTSMLLRQGVKQTSTVSGFLDDLGSDINRFRLRFADQLLWTQQLRGSHKLPALLGSKLTWRFANSIARLDEPDRREYYYVDLSDDQSGDFRVTSRPDSNNRIWTLLIDGINDGSVDLEVPLPESWGSNESLEQPTVKVGTQTMLRIRRYQNTQLTFINQVQFDEDFLRQEPDTIWSRDNIDGDNGWILRDLTRPTDAYLAKQVIQSAYAMSRWPLLEDSEIMFGARIERSDQNVITFDPFASEATPISARLTNTDVLPSASFKSKLPLDLVLRGGYGKSVTRPDFRELSQAEYLDVINSTRFVGNKDLQRGIIHNFDLRLEYYFSESESVSLGGFFKNFDSPIEQVDQGASSRLISWDNAKSATNFGIEIDVYKNLDFISETLEDLYISSNFAAIKSQIQLNPGSINTSLARPLQGQSPYILNAQLGWDSDDGLKAALSYNISGQRIQDVGRNGLPDVFQKPFHQLDVNVSKTWKNDLKLTLKAKNLVNAHNVVKAGDRIVRKFKRGRLLTMSIGWSF